MVCVLIANLARTQVCGILNAVDTGDTPYAIALGSDVIALALWCTIKCETCNVGVVSGVD